MGKEAAESSAASGVKGGRSVDRRVIGRIGPRRGANVRKALVVSAIAVVAIMVSMVGTSGAAGQITNSDIATGAVNSRTILDAGIFNRDIHTAAVNSRAISDGGVGYVDIASSAKNTLQNASIRSGVTVRGVVGGDFEGIAPTGAGNPCENNCDWGVDESLPFPAPVGLNDSHVLVDTSLCGTDCPGITPDSTESTSDAVCTGTIALPTAPAGVVCIYVAGSGNAVELVGFSVLPGTGASKYGFKLGWVSQTSDDTFVDAVWAYTAP